MAKIRFRTTSAIRVFLLVAAAVTSSVASAEDNPGWYIGGQAFFSKPLDSDDSITSSGSSATTTTPSGLLGLLFPSTLPPLTTTIIPPVCASPLGILCSGGGTASSSFAGSSGNIGFAYKSGYALGGNIGYAYANGLRPELELSYSQNDVSRFRLASVTDSNPDAGIKAFRLFLNGWYDFRFSDTLKPYVGAGLGAQRTKLQLYGSSFTTTAFAYQLGTGINWWFTPETTLSLDYRFVDSRPEHDLGGGSTLNTKFQTNQIGVGLKYFFGGESSATAAPAAEEATQVVPPVETPPAPAKKCPNVPAGISPDMLDADGCPLDNDGDGIPDYLDECPHSPSGAKVLPNGCALKNDCRKPHSDEKVDENGCALDKTFILTGVKFDFDSDRLTPESKIILNDVAETLKSNPEIKVEVAGHTDDIGTDAYNLGLSEHRANTVKTYLESRGVEGTRMMPVGYGKTMPIDTNGTDAGRENNRRVEFKVNN